MIQSQLDDTVSERDDALARAREVLQQADNRRSDKADVMMKAEIDRLRTELYAFVAERISTSSHCNALIPGRRVRRT